MNIQIGLSIIQINHVDNSTPLILSAHPSHFQLPTIHFHHKTIIDAIHELSQKCVDLSPMWLNFELVDVILDTINDQFTIVYGGMVPFNTRIFNNEWLETKLGPDQEFDLAIKTLRTLGNIKE